MRKIFLFIVAALFATNLWAECPARYVDTIPAQRYMTNMSLVIDDNESNWDWFSFEDTFRNDLSLDRVYHIYTEGRHSTDLTSGCKWFYVTPETDPGNSMHWYRYEYFGERQSSTSWIVDESTGGKVEKDLSSVIKGFVENGIKDIIIVVNPQYKETTVNPVTGETKSGYVSIYGSQDKYDVYNINYYTFSIPAIYRNRLSSNDANFGEEFVLNGYIQAIGAVNYKLQENSDPKAWSWQTIQSGTISTADARAGKDIQYKKLFNENGVQGKREYRLIATDVASGKSDTTGIRYAEFKYKCVINGQTEYKAAGEKIILPTSADCQDYKITSDLPITKKISGEYIEFTMPACNVWMDEITPIYTVKFYNADYTLLKTEEVPCGESATAPSNPTMAGATFKGWSVDFSNVHKNLVVWAQYDMGSNYTFTSQMTSHANDVYPAEGFAGSDDKAMVGDKITFEATVKIPTSGTLFFQEGTYDLYGNLNWNDGVSVANLSSNEQKVVSRSADVAWYPSSLSERAWVRRAAYRFYIKASGNTVYSDGYEFDVYYKQTINTAGDIIVTNQTGQSTSDNPALLYARYGDTIFVEKTTGNNGCLHLSRTLKPMSSFETGLTEDKKAFFVCPGETEEIAVTVPNYAVVFDGAYPMQHYDFRDQGLGQYNAFYAEVAPCGGKVLPPADPTDEGYIFKGWIAWSSDYADDAYLNIPAINDNMLGFTAQWEEIPEAPLYTVTFLDWDGTTLKTEEVREGENATPPVPGGRAGYHFVGWDKPYTTITANTTITAQYGQDEIYHTVVFLDWDNTELATQQVLDGEPAHEPIAIREGYKFQYWIDTTTSEKADVTAVWSDMTVKAYYTATEGVEFIPVPQEKARKYMIDGTIYIALPDGRIYNANGLRVK